MAQQMNPVNEPTQKGVGSHSTFRPNYSHYQTMRFGELTPSLAMEVVPKDRIALRATKDVDTFTLKAPLMTAVRHLSTFQYVPLRAILPNTAELIITNPLVGDDVDAEECNCGVKYSTLRKFVRALVSRVSEYNTSEDDFTDASWNDFLTSWTLLMSICSNGSLLANMGINLHDMLECKVDGKKVSIDVLYEMICDSINRRLLTSTDPDVTCSIILHELGPDGDIPQVFFVYKTGNAPDLDNCIDFRRLMELLRDGYYITSNGIGDVESVPFMPVDWYIDLRVPVVPEVTDDDYKDFINLSRLAAYQIVCADFFSNDKVDAVYSAMLYRQNMQSLYEQFSGSLSSFDYNGVKIFYDALSCHYISSVLNSLVITNAYAWYYFQNLFGFQRSLRFGDYFAGAKVSPLAVGDVNVGVDQQSMSIDIIDVSQNIQRQRFLNQVNRVGRKFKDYLKGIFDESAMPDAHEPVWIGDFSNIIGAEETANTGNEQFVAGNNKSANLRSNKNNYAFDLQVHEQGVIIGIDYFDCPRAYDSGVDRLCLAADRYEMFNPFMQFIGDQDVKGIEIDPAQLSPFGYQLRYAEYKERVDRCAGGFVDYLPGYAIIVNHRSLSNLGVRSSGQHISSDFIRAHASEFDQLYFALPFFGPAGYFHFIVRSDFTFDAKRPMSFAPSIL